jgi:hypothetical protein
VLVLSLAAAIPAAAQAPEPGGFAPDLGRAGNVVGGGGASVLGGGENTVVVYSLGGGGGGLGAPSQPHRTATLRNGMGDGPEVAYLEGLPAGGGREAWLTGGGDNAWVTYSAPSAAGMGGGRPHR